MLFTEYAKMFFYVPSLLVENIIGIIIVATLLGPIWGMSVVIVGNLIFNSFGIGQEFIIIIFITKLIEPVIIGIINYKKDKKIYRFIVTIFILSLIVPFIGIVTSTYAYQYAAEAYDFTSHIKSSMDMYLEFLKAGYLNNLGTYILSFVISVPILYVFNKRLDY